MDLYHLSAVSGAGETRNLECINENNGQIGGL